MDYPNCHLESLFSKDPLKPILFENSYIYPWDELKIGKGDEFILNVGKNANSYWQGIKITPDANHGVEIDNLAWGSYTFFQEPGDAEYHNYIKILKTAKKKQLLLRNAWKENGEEYSMRGNSAFHIYSLRDNTRIYICNAGFQNTSFDGLVFSLRKTNGEQIRSLMDEKISPDYIPPAPSKEIAKLIGL